jgi:hypothetical protein
MAILLFPTPTPNFRKKFLCGGNIVYELTSYHPKTESEFLSENCVCVRVVRTLGLQNMC